MVGFMEACKWKNTLGKRKERGIEGTGEWVIEITGLNLKAVLSMCILSERNTFYWFLKSLWLNYDLP